MDRDNEPETLASALRDLNAAAREFGDALLDTWLGRTVLRTHGPQEENQPVHV